MGNKAVNGPSYNGLLNVYKEAGYTSNDVVAKLRGILHQRKIGHTGTLDPDAVGVLVVCLGRGTRLVEMLTEHSKEYIAVCRLGIETDTEDLSGEVLVERPEEAAAVTREQLREAVMAFKGSYDQIPPMYSAIKVQGRKLYELAREGKTIERQPRRVTIDAISILDDSHLEDRHEFTMEIKCSKGTYIRTLCADIGARLGCGAAMAQLTRTAVDAFHLEDALTLSEIEKRRDEGTVEDCILSVEEVFRDLDRLSVKPSAMKLIQNGNAFRLSDVAAEDPEDAMDVLGPEESFPDGTCVRVYGEGVFYGVWKYQEKRREFQVEKFLWEG